jgi:transposase
MGEAAILVRGGKPIAVPIEAQDRIRLEGWARRPQTAQALALRGRIVWRAAEGGDSSQIARAWGGHAEATRKGRGRCAAHGWEGLWEEPRPGQPRQLTAPQREAVMRRTWQSKPAGAPHWSPGTRAPAWGLHPTAVGRIGRVFALQPHRSENCQLSQDPLCIDQVGDIVGR